jgi:photosystem II stability/assembly factor-like uncharacterized protein
MRAAIAAPVLACVLVTSEVTVAQQGGGAAAPAPGQAAPAIQRPKPVMLASVDPALLSGLNYRLVRPSRGGRVTTVTGVPSQPKTFYMGVASGGVFRTTDGGTTWTPITDGQIPLGSIGSIAVAELNPDIIYVGTGSDGVRSNVSTGRGIYKSTNGGDTFAKISTGLPTELIGKGNLATTAANPSRICALVEAKPGGGLYRSDDAGASWVLVNSTPGLVQRPFYYTTLGADQMNADVVYAGAEGFYKSVDGGKTLTGLRTPHGDNHDI